jgi:hypothetical protein
MKSTVASSRSCRMVPPGDLIESAKPTVALVAQ